MNERELIELLKKDDPLAMQTIFKTFHSSLCRLVYNISKDADQAKDIVQDVFIKVWQNRHELNITGSLEAYLRRAAVNTALNHIERNQRSKTRELYESNLTRLAANPTAEAMSYKELSQHANKAISELPVRTRVVYTLIRNDDMSYKEVAETLYISTKAVEKEMMRALRLLRVALKDFLNPSLILLLAQVL
jgi:RNA polymerase sigma-70 factor (ECF subfamily)